MGVTLTKATGKITKELKEGGKAVATAEEDVPVAVSDGISQPSKASSGTPTQSDDTPWCSVGVNASYTHNLGNYSSAKVGISIIVPASHSEIDQVYEFASEWVNSRMETAIAELQE